MSKFSKGSGKKNPEISTASLPDIIFMLLFFFMVTTVMRQGELKVDVKVPEATELTKLQQKSLVNYIYIGKPTKAYRELYGTSPRIQLNDKFANMEALDAEIKLFLEAHKTKVSENQRNRITSSIRGDSNVTMGIMQDVKTALRKAGQLRVNYSSRKRVASLN